MIIELLDGPMAGVVHEVAGGFPVPDQFALPDDNGLELYWYITCDDCRTASFDRTEPMLIAKTCDHDWIEHIDGSASCSKCNVEVPF